MAVVFHGVDHMVITMDVGTAPGHVQGVVRMAPGVAMVMVMDLVTVMVTDMVMVTDTVHMVPMVRITLVRTTSDHTTSDHTRLDHIHSCRAALVTAHGRCGKARSFFGTAACRGPWRRARHAGETHPELDHVQFHELEVVDITADSADTVTSTDTDTDTDMATKVRTMTVD